MYTGISYGRYLDTPRCRVSLDNVRMKFSYKYKSYDFQRHEATTAIDLYSQRIDELFYQHCEIKWSRCDFFKIGNYTRTCTISGETWSCAAMFGRYCYDNACKLVAPEIVFDFNPNKVPADWLSSIICILRDGSLKVEIVRYDVAFDFPISREDVTLLANDRQSYKLFREASKGITEYQGDRSSHNAMKLYDKTKESGLSVPVTRCEITVGSGFHGSMQKLFPSLTVFADMQLDTEFAKLPFQVMACIQYPDLIPQLKASVSPNTWRQFKGMLSTYGNAALAPDNWKEVDRFLADTLAWLRGGAA